MWSAITESDVLDELNPKESEVMNEQQGATDKLPAILARVVNMVRGFIIAGGGRVDQPGTIPDQLREDVIAVARWRWLIALPASDDKALQSDARKAAHDDAMKRFDKVSTGDVKVELPAAPLATAAPGNAIEVASSQARKATACKLDGLA
jgi:hypothetical protein